MSAATIIASVFAQFKELFDIEVPSFKITANCTFTFSALIDGDCRVVNDFQKRNNTRALAVGSFDVRAECSHGSPVVSETATVFRQQGILAYRLVNSREIIFNRGEETR